ncbi:Disease resistance protein [Artemisia annua]|uniref:Disease resistance protein n=1 Tax=Artemisia annua TaxID=35608 RepID=A0A2U1MMR8_ARTAN|nr:Disease resistance protein [Artemisia annua]
MENLNEFFDAKITVRSLVYLLGDIKGKLQLKDNRIRLFRNTVFGPWLDIPCYANENHLLNYVLQHQVYVPQMSDDCPPIAYKIGNNVLRFGRREFCLITGFRLGSLSYVEKSHSPFVVRVFPERKSAKKHRVKGDDLLYVLKEDTLWSKISDEDAVRVCLLIVAEIIFMGQKPVSYIPAHILTLVEDFHAWNAYPWGEYMWRCFYTKLENVAPKHYHIYYKKKMETAPKKETAPKTIATYNVFGFVWALKIWILESFPYSRNWWNKDPDKMPRGIAWSKVVTFSKNHYGILFGQDPILHLVPTSLERVQPWYIASDHFLRELSKVASVDRAVPCWSTRDEEKKMIVDKICNEDIGITLDDNDVRVYAIWGMGGIGKTTLAQYVYNHETVKKYFELKCWVLEDKKLDEMSLDDLQRQLQSKLNEKKYFIIMDDVWLDHESHEDMDGWEELCKALSCGAKGSTVMVTTRKKALAEVMAIPELQHNVAVLSKDESWSLFKMLAFPVTGEGENVSSGLEREEKVREGKEIVEKCNGLPLAVKTLGSLMLTKKSVGQWQDVNKNFMNMSKIQDNVLPTLRLSYDDLPPHMKICFAYCCLFSKGEEMSKDLMIELWMANEFIPSKGDVSLYLLGGEIFDTLIGWSFFQDAVEKDIYTGVICKMHDLMHDLALDVMGDDCAVIGPDKELIRSDKVLYLSLSCEDFEFSKQDLKKLRPLRSMLVFDDNYQISIRQMSSHVYIRVLHLYKIKSSTLPESICKLIHLRYLKISRSRIKVIPESIINLQNMQVLILERCWEFRELPKGMRYMRNLQRLDTSSSSLRHMPVGIKELTNLRRLSNFVVGKDDGARIGEMGNLNLVGMRKLELSGPENVGGLREAESANLKDKINLKSLTLVWSHDERSETNDSEVLEGLEPNSGLQELKINRYMGTVISPWMVKLVNLTSINISHLLKCEQLPLLGKLPSLKIIKLWDMDSLKCFHDDDNSTSKDEILFPSLQELHIVTCWSLVSLPSNFPKLQSLEIYTCNKLGSLPDEIQSFKDLNQITIKGCAILSRRCEKGIGEDWPKISHIPHRSIY